MLRPVRILSVLVIAVSFFAATVCAQDSITSPKENASRADLEKWLVNALGKHASYNTRSTSVSVAGIKLDGCSVSFSVLRKANPKNNDTVNAVLKTKGVKHEVAFDISRIEPNGVELTDYLLPEFKTIVIRERYGLGAAPGGNQSRLVEIVVRFEAADAIKDVLDRLRGHCAGGV